MVVFLKGFNCMRMLWPVWDAAVVPAAVFFCCAIANKGATNAKQKTRRRFFIL